MEIIQEVAAAKNEVYEHWSSCSLETWAEAGERFIAKYGAWPL